MTIKEALNKAYAQLADADIPDARLDAELLLSDVLGQSRLAMLLSSTTSLTTEQEQRFSSLLLSRADRKPLQYLLGTQNFYGLDFKVDSRALIPRQETETLCEIGIAHLRQLGTKTASALDLCTGSGAIAVTIKHACPFAAVSASDASFEALTLANENAAIHQADISFFEGDLFAPLCGQKFDLILSNPPYIPSGDCLTLQPEVMQEPSMALDGGTDGLDFYRRIASDALNHLTGRGMIAVEVGDQEASAVQSLFIKAHLSGVSIIKDLYGMERIVAGYAADFT